MNKWFIILFVVIIVFSILVSAETTINFLTKAQADTLYCSKDDCGGSQWTTFINDTGTTTQAVLKFVG